MADHRPPFDPRSLEFTRDECTPEERQAAEDRGSLDPMKRLDGVFFEYSPKPAKDGAK